MAWKGRHSSKAPDQRDFDELVEELESRSMRSSRVQARDIPRRTIGKNKLTRELSAEISTATQMARSSLTKIHMKGSVPRKALATDVRRQLESNHSLAQRANNPIAMAGAIPAAAADLTDDWSFKRIGLHAGTAISSDGDVTVGAATFYLVATGSGNVTIGLPAAATCANMVLSFKKIAAANSMILDANASETIDGATTKTLGDQWSWVTIISNGTSWFIISQGNP
tara:strand:- start:468 stop:1145 length:678 start_codon:yes stop_codon:yes gene_type:complete